MSSACCARGPSFCRLFVRFFFLLQLFLVAAAGPSQAIADGTAPIEDRDNRFSLAIPEGLSRATAPEGSLALHYRTGARGLVASISRFDAANRAAFRKGESGSFLESIERGLRKSTQGFRLHRRESQKLGRVPSLDLEFSRKNSQGQQERVWMRMLFHYRFTVVATATLPASTPRRARRLARDFTRGLVPLP